MEPGNRQAQELEKAIKKSMESGMKRYELNIFIRCNYCQMKALWSWQTPFFFLDAIKGVAIAGGGVLLAGALVGLGMSLLKK